MLFQHWCLKGRGATFICHFFCLRVYRRQTLVHEWPLRNGIATFLRTITDTIQTAQTVQYSDSQCTQQQYWYERQRCSWLHAGLFCIAPGPFTRFVFYYTRLGIAL